MEPARLAGSAVLRTQSDERLVDLVRDGNDRAFEAIVHRYRRPLLRYCGRFLASARADDAVQQTFVNAFGAIRSGDAEINLRPWLYRIAHNAALNVLRQAGADHEEISEQIDGVETPPQALERGERFRSVVSAVRGLPDRQRDALVLQALEGRSYDEIAVELGVTGGAVRQLLNRARTTLREGVTAVTPPALLLRLGGAIDAPVSERVAQAVAGAGGGAALAKVAAIVVVGGAAVGGAGDRVLVHHGHGGRSAEVASPAKVARSIPTRSATRDQTVALTNTTHRHGQGSTGGRHGENSGQGSAGSRSSGPGSGNDVRSEVEHHSSRGPGGGDSSGGGDRHSGGGSGDSSHSGSSHDGSSGGDDRSGSGSSGSDDSGVAAPVEDSAPIQSDPLTIQSKDGNSGSGSNSGSSGSGSSGSSNSSDDD